MRSGRGRLRARLTQIGQSAFYSMPDQRQRTNETDDSTCRDGAGTDIKNVAVLNLIDAHLRDRVTGFRRNRPRD